MKKLVLLIIITSFMSQLRADTFSFNEGVFLSQPEKSCPKGLKGIYTPHCSIANTRESYRCQADSVCGGSYWQSLRPCTFEDNILNCMGRELNPRLCSTEKPIANCGGRLQCGNCLANQPFDYPMGFDGPYKKYCHDCWVDQSNKRFLCTCGDKDVKGNVGPSHQFIAVLIDFDSCEPNTIAYVFDTSDGSAALTCQRKDKNMKAVNKLEDDFKISNQGPAQYPCKNCKLVRGHWLQCDCHVRKISGETITSQPLPPMVSEVDLLNCPPVRIERNGVNTFIAVCNDINTVNNKDPKSKGGMVVCLKQNEIYLR